MLLAFGEGALFTWLLISCQRLDRTGVGPGVVFGLRFPLYVLVAGGLSRSTAIDMVDAVSAWNDVDFDGVIRIDHCPGVVGDNGRADRSFAFQVGYLRGLVQSLENMGEAA